MPTRNVNLTDQLDSFIASKIESGRYANVSEVVRAGLRALEEDEAEDLAKLEALRAAVAAGDEGPWLDGPTVFAEIYEDLNRQAGRKIEAATGD